MKKYLYLALAATTLAACSDVEDLSSGQQGGTSNVIGFQVQGNNSVTRATKLQDAGHYNFGVFAYKSTDKVNNVMSNYLVGYFDEDEDKGYQKTGSTVGDNNDAFVDGKSHWMYENMGNTQYHGTYAGGALETFYTSNNDFQFLKYWDKSAESTCFYAYAPYIGTLDADKAKRVTYVDGTAQSATGGDTYVMNIPNGTLVAGYDDASKHEFMYASKKVSSGNYGHDVSLEFKRLVAKVNIKFWEDVAGYKVRILDLKQGTYDGVYAAASVKEDGVGNYGYKGGKYYTSNGVKIHFNNGEEDGKLQYAGTLADNNTPLKFKSPTESAIGTNRFDASASPTTYYAIPKGAKDASNHDVKVLKNSITPVAPSTSTYPDYNDAANQVDPDELLSKTGFTFHVTYELTAEDSGERIVVKNATVHVPFDYCNWDANKHYTYIFKITNGTNGSTEKDPTIDPTDPEVPTTPALYPIVFDNCTVADWDEDESEWNITDGTALSYHNITLKNGGVPTYSVDSRTGGTLKVEIANDDKHKDAAIAYGAVTLSGPDLTNVTYSSATHDITINAGAAAGVYTVTYTCPGTDVNGNHPTTWTAKFVVGEKYNLFTHRDVIGTKYNAANESEYAKLNVTATRNDGMAYSPDKSKLSIEYPSNFTDPQKQHVYISSTASDVVVAPTAAPGKYKVVYTETVDGQNVKVAEKTFEVKDYRFTLSHTVVYNKVGGTDVTGSQAADVNHVYTVNGGIGTFVGKKLSVPNETAEGTYTVTYTVYGTEADKAVYTQTFEVRNSYGMIFSKDNIDRNQGTSNPGEETHDAITVSTLLNDLPTTADISGSLDVVGTESATVTAETGFSITYTSGNSYTLKCNNNVSTGTYYVRYKYQLSGETKAVYKKFTVLW